jgi:hypothetical protein
MSRFQSIYRGVIPALVFSQICEPKIRSSRQEHGYIVTEARNAGEPEMAKDEKAADQTGGIAEQAMEQARRAADTYCDFVKQAIAATPSGGNEFAERIKGYAEKNITMTQEYLRQLSQVRNFQDMVRIQADFMQSLMKAFGEQSLGEAYKAAADTARKPTSGMS